MCVHVWAGACVCEEMQAYRMAHTTARGSGDTGDKAHNRLLDLVILKELGSLCREE